MLIREAGPAAAGLEVALNRDTVREELRSVMVLLKVFHTRTKFVHVVKQRGCVRTDPRSWITLCGWPFMDSRESRVIFEDDEVEQFMKPCAKCAG